MMSLPVSSSTFSLGDVSVQGVLCQEVHSLSGVDSLSGRRGGLFQETVSFRRCVSVKSGVSVRKGVSVRRPPIQWTSRRYAFYWNAVLLFVILLDISNLTRLQFQSISLINN